MVSFDEGGVVLDSGTQRARRWITWFVEALTLPYSKGWFEGPATFFVQMWVQLRLLNPRLKNGDPRQ
jgi:hypothetical protein